MSNKRPNTAGITRYWMPGHDARCLLEDELLTRGCEPDGLRERIDGFLDALMTVVGANRRSVFVGVGTFAWTPWIARLPDGRMVETWHMSFKPSRYAERPARNHFAEPMVGEASKQKGVTDMATKKMAAKKAPANKANPSAKKTACKGGKCKK